MSIWGLPVYAWLIFIVYRWETSYFGAWRAYVSSIQAVSSNQGERIKPIVPIGVRADLRCRLGMADLALGWDDWEWVNTSLKTWKELWKHQIWLLCSPHQKTSHVGIKYHIIIKLQVLFKFFSAQSKPSFQQTCWMHMLIYTLVLANSIPHSPCQRD